MAVVVGTGNDEVSPESLEAVLCHNGIALPVRKHRSVFSISGEGLRIRAASIHLFTEHDTASGKGEYSLPSSGYPEGEQVLLVQSGSRALVHTLHMEEPSKA